MAKSVDEIMDRVSKGRFRLGDRQFADYWISLEEELEEFAKTASEEEILKLEENWSSLEEIHLKAMYYRECLK